MNTVRKIGKQKCIGTNLYVFVSEIKYALKIQNAIHLPMVNYSYNNYQYSTLFFLRIIPNYTQTKPQENP